MAASDREEAYSSSKSTLVSLRVVGLISPSHSMIAILIMSFNFRNSEGIVCELRVNLIEPAKT